MSSNQRGVGKEHPKSHLIQFLAGLIFFPIWISDSFLFKFTIILTNYIPFIIRLTLFLGFLIISLFLIFKGGHILFHTEPEPSKLVISGLFAHVRHPLYLGVILMYLGVILLSMSLISLIGWVIVIILYDGIATYEEKDLERIFGEEYLEYKKSVPKWIPRL